MNGFNQQSEQGGALKRYAVNLIDLAKQEGLFEQKMGDLLLNKQPEKTLAFYRKGLLFAFNFHPEKSLTDVAVEVPNYADYTVAMSSDDEKYGGWDRVAHQTYKTRRRKGKNVVQLYLPARTAVVLKEGKIRTIPGTRKKKETK